MSAPSAPHPAPRRRGPGVRRPLPRVLVLMYHGVAEVPAAEDQHNLFVTPGDFAAQLDRLQDRGFEAVTEADFVAGVTGRRSLPSRSVLITLDDGFTSVRRHAAPLLAERGMPAVCYVSSSLVGSRSADGTHQEFDLMGWDEVRELPAHGVSVGSHGCGHESLPTLTDAQVLEEIAGSRARLADALGGAPLTFAHPFGHHEDRTRRAVRSAGYGAGLGIHHRRDPYAYPRVDVNATDTLRSFDIKIAPWYPSARRAASLAPAARRLAHHLIGHRSRT